MAGASEAPDTISEEEFARWLTPSQTYDLLKGQWTYDVITDTILRLLMHDMLLARAATVIKEVRGSKTYYHRTRIPYDEWGPENPSPYGHFWDNGQFEWSSGSGYDGRDFACFDVRFDPAVVRGLVEAKVDPQAQSPTPIANKGGAPRKGWWDELWIEMIRRIRADELHPETAAELERTMLDWLGEQGCYPGEDTLKKTARKLFKYLQE